MAGSIGGGIMEYKLVEKAKDMISKQESDIFFKPQFHRKSAPANQSGMICSGEQIVVLLPLNESHKTTVNQISECLASNGTGGLIISNLGIQFQNNPKQINPFDYTFKTEEQWQFKELIAWKPTVHIIGGGHVGSACCELFFRLDFHVINYDDRQQLNTMEDNHSVHEKKVFDYQQIGSLIPEGKHQYVVIMSFGYRSDKVIIQQLAGKAFAYLGMMGSKAKIEQLKTSLLEEGMSPRLLDSVFMPIGVPIDSKTPMEIAVSIAAQIISQKNKTNT